VRIKKPTMIIDRPLTIKKIEWMANKARASNVRFRPHFKTHQSAEIGNWFKKYNVSSIAVSSVDMAIYFAENGWNDIMICTPTNIHQIDQINKLAEQIELHALVDSLETTEKLGNEMQNDLNVWIEIDVGYKRTGVPSIRIGDIKNIAKSIQKKPYLLFAGIITHAGHAYHAHSINEIITIYQDSIKQLSAIREALLSEGHSDIQVSIGDTPTCSLIERFEKPITEIRPGNFVFYDLIQLNIGSCKENDISMTIACPVISKHPERNELVIYGGGASLSKEGISHEKYGTIHGLICLPDNKKGRTNSIKDVYISSLSQEHGKIKGPPEFIEKVKIGDILLVLPVHACQAAILHAKYQTFEGQIFPKFRA